MSNQHRLICVQLTFNIQRMSIKGHFSTSRMKEKHQFIDFHQTLTTNDTFLKTYTFQDRG